MHGNSAGLQGPTTPRPTHEEWRSQHGRHRGDVMDSDDEANDYYAGIASSSVLAVGSDHHPRDILVSPHQNSSDSFALRLGMQDDRFVDANTGLPLDEGLCRAARQTDLEYFVSKGAWELRTINEARAKIDLGIAGILVFVC